jgi:hypothetical protein
MGKTKYKIATIINYCTNDYKFISHCINEAKIFSEQVIVPVCDHYLDGAPESRELLEKTYNENLHNAEFCEYKYNRNLFDNLIGNAKHAYSRFVGIYKSRDDIDYILFIDSDEIIEGIKFKEYLDKSDFKNYNALLFSCYYYFRDVKFRAKKMEDPCLLVKKSMLSSDMMKQVLSHGQDRIGILSVIPEERRRNILGLDGKPMAHHYSWVRTKEEMIRKVQTFGHKYDRDWISLVEKEFSHEFNGFDFVHGYEYEVVEPYVSIGT